MKENKNILNSVGKRNPFTVPENYFENFAANLGKKLEKEPVLDADAPFALGDAPVKDTDLKAEAQALTVETTEKKPVVVSFYKGHIQPLLHVAAVCAILVGISYLIAQPFMQPYKDAKVELAACELSESDYDDLVEDYDTEELYEILANNN